MTMATIEEPYQMAGDTPGDKSLQNDEKNNSQKHLLNSIGLFSLAETPKTKDCDQRETLSTDVKQSSEALVTPNWNRNSVENSTTRDKSHELTSPNKSPRFSDHLSSPDNQATSKAEKHHHDNIHSTMPGTIPRTMSGTIPRTMSGAIPGTIPGTIPGHSLMMRCDEVDTVVGVVEPYIQQANGMKRSIADDYAALDLSVKRARSTAVVHPSSTENVDSENTCDAVDLSIRNDIKEVGSTVLTQNGPLTVSNKPTFSISKNTVQDEPLNFSSSKSFTINNGNTSCTASTSASSLKQRSNSVINNYSPNQSSQIKRTMSIPTDYSRKSVDEKKHIGVNSTPKAFLGVSGAFKYNKCASRSPPVMNDYFPSPPPAHSKPANSHSLVHPKLLQPKEFLTTTQRLPSENKLSMNEKTTNHTPFVPSMREHYRIAGINNGTLKGQDKNLKPDEAAKDMNKVRKASLTQGVSFRQYNASYERLDLTSPYNPSRNVQSVLNPKLQHSPRDLSVTKYQSDEQKDKVISPQHDRSTTPNVQQREKHLELERSRENKQGSQPQKACTMRYAQDVMGPSQPLIYHPQPYLASERLASLGAPPILYSPTPRTQGSLTRPITNDSQETSIQLAYGEPSYVMPRYQVPSHLQHQHPATVTQRNLMLHSNRPSYPNQMKYYPHPTNQMMHPDLARELEHGRKSYRSLAPYPISSPTANRHNVPSLPRLQPMPNIQSTPPIIYK